MLLALALLSFACALLPAVLFLANLRLFAPPPAVDPNGPPLAVSVLIPARNEAARLQETLRCVLASEQAEFEVIVLDDASTDGTAELVSRVLERDARVRLEQAPPLPAGWNGKQHACHHLARLARHPRLLFLDADVRLAPDALARLLPLLEGCDLLSGVPRQVTGSLSEMLLIPLIHFVLLGFLPLARMRQSPAPSLGAGCGQLFLTTADAYRASGGHAAIRASLHDGLHLPRLYRRAGLRTDLTDLTPLAWCRMYEGDAATWRGLAKNAHQGMGAWGAIFPMTALLLCGQVLPWALLSVGVAQALPTAVWLLAALGAGSGIGVRALAARRFQHTWLGVLLHPLGVLGLLGLQCWARARHSLGFPSRWKGRACS